MRHSGYVDNGNHNVDIFIDSMISVFVMAFLCLILLPLNIFYCIAHYRRRQCDAAMKILAGDSFDNPRKSAQNS